MRKWKRTERQMYFLLSPKEKTRIKTMLRLKKRGQWPDFCRWALDKCEHDFPLNEQPVTREELLELVESLRQTTTIGRTASEIVGAPKWGV